jgi:hypothetical protein
MHHSGAEAPGEREALRRIPRVDESMLSVNRLKLKAKRALQALRWPSDEFFLSSSAEFIHYATFSSV